jgi:glycosyltransferase involved in cell wall biosynthesis
MSQPVLRVVAPHEDLSAPSPYVRSIALIGTYPPRRCGIATFTADVYEALRQARPDATCDVYALTDVEEAYEYPPEVVCEIGQDKVADYLAAADRLSATMPDLICVQHEFGIFGGFAGEHLLMLLEATDRPVVTTLHTILETPEDDQRRVFARLLTRSARVVVMAERGREILRRVWSVPADKILFIPHGAPDRELGDTAAFKEALGYGGRELLFTFGLLSPGKGIETVIRALPRIVAERPNVTYVVLGATHPHLIALEGETYRHSLVELAEDLGVADHVCLTDVYTDTTRLVEHLQAADIYVTPYLNAQQITSGTLAYAAALGRAIVSTPYWHAEELLADGRGRLTPFGSSDAIADEVIDLLTHPDVREALGRRMWQASRETVWPRFGVRMIEAFDSVLARSKHAEPMAAPWLVDAMMIAPSLGGVRRMTDGCGILQHSLFGVPDRRHGYCVDDNARALILMHRLPGPVDAERADLTSTYAAFLAHAWNDDEKRFRNFLSFERTWLEPRGSEDSHGRSVWAVATTAVQAADPGQRRWAASLTKRIFEADDEVSSPRAIAFIVLGLSALVEAGFGGGGPIRRLLVAKADRLARLFRRNTDDGCPWFEPFLAYDNARLPEALIRSGLALDVAGMVSAGVEALEWLCSRQTGPRGCFQPVATVDFGRSLAARNLFDQQPVEAAATIDACQAAWMATGDQRWIEEAQRAYAWFLGGNTLATPLTTGDGDCFDGLTWAGVNENQGAESVLSLQLATCALHTLTEAAASRLKRSATPSSP